MCTTSPARTATQVIARHRNDGICLVLWSSTLCAVFLKTKTRTWWGRSTMLFCDLSLSPCSTNGVATIYVWRLAELELGIWVVQYLRVNNSTTHAHRPVSGDAARCYWLMHGCCWAASYRCCLCCRCCCGLPMAGAADYSACVVDWWALLPIVFNWLLSLPEFLAR